MQIIDSLEYYNNLTISDFTSYFDKGKLGRLYFPVGKAYDQPGGGFFDYAAICSFFIKLDELYKIVVGWRINNQDIKMEEIIAIIAFGSAVGPGTKEVERSRKKYLMFGSKEKYTTEINVTPQDADFFVITKKDMIEEKVLKPISMDTYDCGTWIVKGGIHLVNRSKEQCSNGVLEEDTVSINALSKGVPIFYTEEFKEFRKEIKLPNDSLYDNVRWKVSDKGILTGTIG